MRAARASTKTLAARPEPSPTTAPSWTKPRACDASATSGSSVVAAMRDGPDTRIPPCARDVLIVWMRLTPPAIQESPRGARASERPGGVEHVDDAAPDHPVANAGRVATGVANP